MKLSVKKKLLIFSGIGIYLLFLVSIHDNQIIQNNAEQKIEADAYFYTEMKTVYFQAR